MDRNNWFWERVEIILLRLIKKEQRTIERDMIVFVAEETSRNERII